MGFNIASCILGSIGVGLEDKTIALYLSALDIDIENARQNEELSELNFTLKISVGDDLCDQVDTEVYYQIQFELNHPNSDFLGKIFTFSVNAGRINIGNAATMTIKRLTNGNIALDSISVSRVIVQDLLTLYSGRVSSLLKVLMIVLLSLVTRIAIISRRD